MIWVTRVVKVNQNSIKERETKKTRIGPMRCSSCLGRGRSSRGQADQLPDSSPHSQHVPTLLPGCPEEGQLLIGGGEGWGRGNLGGCQLNLLPKWKQGQRRQQERMNLQIKKGNREQKEKQVEMATPETARFTCIKWRN